MQKRTLGVLKYLVIFGAVLWSLPAIADETPSSTPDIATSTPEVATSTPSPEPEAEVTPTPYSTLTIRYQDQIIFNGTVNLTTTTYHDVINNIDYPLNGTSTVFSLLVNADLQNDSFSISDDQFNTSWNSFYLNCLSFTIATTTENKCGNWQYTVDGQYLPMGMDKKEISGNENIYIYFGDRYNFTTEKNSYSVNEIVTTTLKEYTYSINDWTLMDGQLVLATTQPDFSDYYNWPPAQTISSVSTTNGLAFFQFATSGTYYITLPDYSYWPYLTISVTSTATTSTQTTTSSPEQSPNEGGSGSGSAPAISTTEINNSVQKILNFLKSRQSNDGSIADLQMSDWTAMSFGANGTYAKDVQTSTFSLYDYLNTTLVTSTTQTLNRCTEYSRHILGLLAAGFSKTNTQIVDLKNKINTECLVDGQVGQAGINDDIFILLALLATDENPTSEIIQTSVNTIKADQQTSGAFTWNGWAGQDATGAAINALRYASTFGVIVDDLIFQNAKTYLHNTQLTDGGWGFDSTSDPFTTSWAMYGLNALGEGQTQWTNSNNQNPWTLLANKLGTNGYYETTWSSDGIDWFTTKHAVPALLGTSWPIILNPITQPSTGGSGGFYDILSTSTEITSIITTTTTSTIISTSTISTSTDIGVAVRIEIDPKELGEILGIKIDEENEEPNTGGPENLEPTILSVIENTDTTTTLETHENQSTTTQTESDQKELSANSPAREMVKKLFIISIMGAGIITIYLGFKSFIKRG